MVFHWSVFTHLYPGESYLYTVDVFRALKPGKMIFSLPELEEPEHDRVWNTNLEHLSTGPPRASGRLSAPRLDPPFRPRCRFCRAALHQWAERHGS